MKAATIARYGSPGVVEVRVVPAPVPGPDEVLVRVHAATVNRSDCGELLHPTIIRLLTGAGRSRRTILGMDFAGTVEAASRSVSHYVSPSAFNQRVLFALVSSDALPTSS